MQKMPTLIFSFVGYTRQNNVHFENEGHDDALRMLTNSEFRRVKVWWFWFNCGVDKYKSWYIACNGSEIPLMGDLQLFTIERGYHHNFPYFLKVRSKWFP